MPPGNSTSGIYGAGNKRKPSKRIPGNTAPAPGRRGLNAPTRGDSGRTSASQPSSAPSGGQRGSGGRRGGQTSDSPVVTGGAGGAGGSGGTTNASDVVNGTYGPFFGESVDRPYLDALVQDPSFGLTAARNSGLMSGTGAGNYAPYADLITTFYSLMKLAGNPMAPGGESAGDNTDFLKFNEDYWRGLSGGGAFDSEALWGALNNGGGALNSLLGGTGYDVDALTASNNYEEFANNIASATMHPMVAQAYKAMIDQRQRDYIDQMRTNSDQMPSYRDFLGM